MMKKIFLLITLLNFFIAILTTKVFLLTNNTLNKNNKWDSGKLKLEMGVMGAWNFFNQTQPLNKNYLNLGTWHGFQEIVTKKDFKYNKIEFDTLIDNNAYLVNHFIISDDQKFSIKLSSELQKSYCLTIKESGKFLNKKLLNNLIITPNQWAHVSIIINENEALITINNQTFNCPKPQSNKSKIGFKNGYNDTLIDNIILKNNDKIVFQESFSNNRNILSIITILFLLITLIQSIIFLILIKLFKNKKNILFILIALNTSLLFSILISYMYLLFFFTGNYPNLESFFSKLKTQEQEWIDNEVQIISQQIMENFKNDDQQKIMFLGSSQTWGAGASNKTKSFPIVFENLLNKSLETSSQSSNLSHQILGVSTDQKIKTINAGISGTTSSELLNEYQNEWIKLKPNLVFVNLSSNDFTYDIPREIFKRNIEKLIELNRENNIQTVLLIEASSNELKIENYFHTILKEMAQRESILIIDINDYLKEKNNTGLIWWDFIHPTDYGHQLIAEYILEILIENNKIIH